MGIRGTTRPRKATFVSPDVRSLSLPIFLLLISSLAASTTFLEKDPGTAAVYAGSGEVMLSTALAGLAICILPRRERRKPLLIPGEQREHPATDGTQNDGKIAVHDEDRRRSAVELEVGA